MKACYQLVGMKHRGTMDIVKALPNGATVMLVREPSNTFDRFAVKVMSGVLHLGYIKSTDDLKLLAIKMDGDKRSEMPAKLVAHEWPMIEVDE